MVNGWLTLDSSLILYKNITYFQPPATKKEMIESVRRAFQVLMPAESIKRATHTAMIKLCLGQKENIFEYKLVFSKFFLIAMFAHSFIK